MPCESTSPTGETEAGGAPTGEVRPAVGSPDPSEWVADHGDALFRYACARLRDREAAEELVQETFLSALAARDGFRGESAIRTWLTAILRRKIADHHRHVGRTEDVPEERLRELSDGPGHDPVAACEGADFWEVFHACAGKLPPNLSEAYRLREILELPAEEICRMLDISPGNLAVRLHRAREGL